jgi:hypothetical protein
VLKRARVVVAAAIAVFGACALLSLGGCGGGGGHESVTAGEPVAATMSCSPDSLDDYTFDVISGRSVDVAIDTIDPAHAAEFAFSGNCGVLAFSGTAAQGSPCTAGAFACPVATFMAEFTGTCFLRVTIPSANCADSTSLATYALTVRVDGDPTAITAAADFDAPAAQPLPNPPPFNFVEDLQPCGSAVDVWSFQVRKDETIVVGVDTTMAATAADLAFDVSCNDQPVLSRDDELQCTFPPPSFACPLGAFVATDDGDCTVTVRSFSCTQSDRADYGLGVTRNGTSLTAAELQLVADDQSQGPQLPPFTFSEDISPCSTGPSDTLQFQVSAGDAVVFATDTVDNGSVAFLPISVPTCSGGAPQNVDREVIDCVSTPQFSCSILTFDAVADGTCNVAITSSPGSCVDPNVSRYRVGVTRNGASTDVVLVTDDKPQVRPPLNDRQDFMPCGSGIVDTWEFPVSEGETVVIEANTIASETASDLALTVRCGGNPVLGADDEIPCNFPPPQFACPLGTFTAPATGTCEVSVQSLGACVDPSRAEYALGVTRNDAPAALTLTGDDVAPPPPPPPPPPIPSPTFTSTEDLTPCATGSTDIWEFQVAAGDDVNYGTDTIDTATAANLRVGVVCTDGSEGPQFEVSCPSTPDVPCALGTFTALDAGTCRLTVTSFAFQVACADPNTAAYRLGVARNGVSADLTLITDDELPPPRPELTFRGDVSPCGGSVEDQVQFDVAAGEDVVVSADTADAETAADLLFEVQCGSTVVLMGDDDVACSESRFGCPFGRFIAAGDATCVASISTFNYSDISFGCSDSTIARYRFGVTRSGTAADLTLIQDNGPRTAFGVSTNRVTHKAGLGSAARRPAAASTSSKLSKVKIPKTVTASVRAKKR